MQSGLHRFLKSPRRDGLCNHVIRRVYGKEEYGYRISLYRWQCCPATCAPVSFYHRNATRSLVSPESAFLLASRRFHLTVRVRNAEGTKSKVEEAVSNLRDQIKEKSEVKIFEVVKPEPVPPKRTIWQRIVLELRHYYHGFRLLFSDIKVSSKFVWQLLRGKSLSRREYRLLTRTVSDMFRLVPFSVFIIVPFMEFLLPVFIKLFPSMLPSTFQTDSEREQKIKTKLKLKLEMAKFLQDTLEAMSLQSVGEKRSQRAKEFSQFIEKIRTTGQQATNEEIMQFSKLFEDELTLDNLNRGQLAALCRLLELQPIGTNNFLRFQLRMKLRSLKADDQMIQKEGIDNLTSWEIQQACRARGMRSLGVTDQRLRSQLAQWLDLSLNEKIPPSLLLLSRALYLPDHLPEPERLLTTLSQLPDTAATEAKAKIGELEGKVDNRIRRQLLKAEEAKIKAEKEEQRQVLAQQKITEALNELNAIKEELKDAAPVLTDKAALVEEVVKPPKKKEEAISPSDFDEIEDALENISNEKKKLLIEKEELLDLKEEMEEYKEDIEELKDVIVQTGKSDKELRESKAATRLSKRLQRMISKMDSSIGSLEHEKIKMQKKIEEGQAEEADRQDLVSVQELVEAMKKLQKIPDETRMQTIVDVLQHMDLDHDGNIKVEDVVKVLELLGKEHETITSKQMHEILEMIHKEENLEMVKKLEKMMEKEHQILPPKLPDSAPEKAAVKISDSSKPSKPS